MLIIGVNYLFFCVDFGNEGHTTMTCPHKVATEHGVVQAPNRNTRSSLDYVFRRQLRPDIPAVSPSHLSCFYMCLKIFFLLSGYFIESDVPLCLRCHFMLTMKMRYLFYGCAILELF